MKTVAQILEKTQYYNGASAKKIVNALINELPKDLFKGVKATKGLDSGDRRHFNVFINTELTIKQYYNLRIALMSAGIEKIERYTTNEKTQLFFKLY